MVDSPAPLPLGSVIRVKGSDKLLMVISRGIAAKNDDGTLKLFEYGACLFPEGLVGDLVAYTNGDCVSEVLFRGYETGESLAMLKVTMAMMAHMREDGAAMADLASATGAPRHEDVW